MIIKKNNIKNVFIKYIRMSDFYDDNDIKPESESYDNPPIVVEAKAKPKVKRKPSAWNQHVSKTYKANKKKNDNYKFKDAMVDAKKTYKKKKG